MLSFLINTDVFRYGYIQLIHMYKQLYAIKNKTLAGGSYTIMFYTIEFHMFICGVQHMNNCSYIQSCVLVICVIYVHMSIYSYVEYMNVCTYIYI